MRFILAIVSFIVAFLLIGYGIAQRTIFAAPDNVAASTTLTSDAPVTIIDSKTLKALDGRQRIEITGAKTIFAAYGRTDDVLAWVGDASYNKIGFDAQKVALTSKLVAGKANKVPDPHGSDLWLAEFSRASALQFTVNVPSGISVIILSDGTAPAPSQLTIRWPLDNRTPWSGPLIVGGAVLLLVGLGLYLWALAHLRKTRGPRRKTPKMPKVPRQRGYKPRKSKAVEVRTGRRRSTTRRMTAILPMLIIGTLALSGCSQALWPEFLGGAANTPTPSATATTSPTSELQAPAVTVPQLKSIVARISAVAAKADADRDAALLSTRFAGPARELRTVNYAIRKVDNTYKALPAIPAGAVEVTLPQQSNTWPRTVFTVVQNPSDKTVAPVAMMLVQATPRDNFKVNYAMALEPKAVLPAVAPANIGAPRLPPDSKLLLIAPSQLALAYGDLLTAGPNSAFNKDFNTANDSLVKSIGLDAKNARKAALPANAAIAFSNAAGTGESIAFGTNDSGAIVAVYLNEIETVTPSQVGATVQPEGATKTLAGLAGSTKGISATHGDQLLFYVPKAGSNEKIVLLGFAEGLIAAKEL
ncbi:MAG: hypothetical protein ACYCZY_10560 [Lacisediminihabitans sp.]